MHKSNPIGAIKGNIEFSHPIAKVTRPAHSKKKAPAKIFIMNSI